ncbi:hypothetical protein OESDEN_12115, partial [Oesophagostomum dentatum]
MACPRGVTSCSMAVFGNGQQVRDQPTERTEMSYDAPPAPPPLGAPSLLCVCTSPLCNAGHYTRV